MSVNSEYDFLIVNAKFPRIGLGIEIRWGTADLEPYIMNLLSDTRDHSRQGFPKEIMTSLGNLLLLHHKLYPEKQKKYPDVWDNIYKG